MLRHDDDSLISHLHWPWRSDFVHNLAQFNILLPLDLLNLSSNIVFSCLLKCFLLLLSLKLRLLLFSLLAFEFLLSEFLLNLASGFFRFGFSFYYFLLLSLFLQKFSGSDDLLLGLGEGRVNCLVRWLICLFFSGLLLDLGNGFGVRGW